MLRCSLILSLLAGLARGYPTGPPKEACWEMKPGHGVEPQEWGSTPFKLEISSDTYEPGMPVQVTLAGSEVFRGIMLQVRKTTYDAAIVGNFSMPDAMNLGYSHLNCSQSQDTVVHMNGDLKTTGATFTWWPPKEPAGNLVVVATVVQEKSKFWTWVMSGEMKPRYDFDPAEPDCEWGCFAAGQTQLPTGMLTLVACLMIAYLAGGHF